MSDINEQGTGTYFTVQVHEVREVTYVIKADGQSAAMEGTPGPLARQIAESPTVHTIYLIEASTPAQVAQAGGQ